MRRRAALLTLAFALLAGTSSSPVAQAMSDGRSSTVPAGLPAHFGIGVDAHPDATGIYGWMPDSQSPWDYAYQYLAGGVNTGYGWRTWNSGGRFPLDYAKGAAANGYLPVFPYYQLLQSKGPCDACDDSSRDLAHLNSASLMSKYFADFRVLMQRLGPGTSGGVKGFGGTAVVIVEPDLSGYAEQAVLSPNQACHGFCTGRGNDPSLLKAAVARSGFADVAGYANTYQGFSLALSHLRDRYAPNVLLAYHVSDWSTFYDVGSSTDPSLDATALGKKAGTFAALAGAATARSDTGRYDVLTNDVGDRDAAYYKYVYGRDVFWDRDNSGLPNFHRWESYVRAAATAAGRSVLVWQIPVGNQYFRSENNTDGLYQDNRAEYFFGHIPEVESAGIIGLLSGRGNGGSTTQWDDQGDGVTDPPAVCTSDGSSSGQICSDHLSSSSDDDGGYLRMAATAYYASPSPL
jgi:hypothetical protein